MRSCHCKIVSAAPRKGSLVDVGEGRARTETVNPRTNGVRTPNSASKDRISVMAPMLRAGSGQSGNQKIRSARRAVPARVEAVARVGMGQSLLCMKDTIELTQRGRPRARRSRCRRTPARRTSRDGASRARDGAPDAL